MSLATPVPDDDMISVEKYKKGMRCLVGGVSIITAAGQDGWRGLTATAVTSLSADPPSILVCVNSRLEAAKAIRETEAFCVNVLRDDHVAIASRFAGMDGATGPEKFALGQWAYSKPGVLSLMDALACFECKLFEFVETSTHTVFMGHVARLKLGDRGRPLIYSDGKFSTVMT